MSEFSIEAYVNGLTVYLSKHSDEVIEKLEEVFSYSFNEEVQLLDFEAFIDPSHMELSVMMYSMDEEGNEVFTDEEEDGFSGSIELFSPITYYEIDEDAQDDFDQFYEDNDYEMEKVENETFATWFKECWDEAAGDSLEIPSYFSAHDSGESFDLKEDRWIDSEAKWN